MQTKKKDKAIWEVNAEIIQRQMVMVDLRSWQRRRAFAKDEARFLDPHDSFGVNSTSLIQRQEDGRRLQTMTTGVNNYLCEVIMRRHNDIFEALDGNHVEQ